MQLNRQTSNSLHKKYNQLNASATELLPWQLIRAGGPFSLDFFIFLWLDVCLYLFSLRVCHLYVHVATADLPPLQRYSWRCHDVISWKKLLRPPSAGVCRARDRDRRDQKPGLESLHLSGCFNVDVNLNRDVRDGSYKKDLLRVTQVRSLVYPWLSSRRVLDVLTSEM